MKLNLFGLIIVDLDWKAVAAVSVGMTAITILKLKFK